MKSKKLTSLMLAATMCAGLMVGCGGGNEDPSPTPTPMPAGDDQTPTNPDDSQPEATLPPMTTEEITLTYMHFDNKDVVDYVAKKFMDKYPNITVKCQDYVADTTYNDSLMNLVNAQKTPDCYMLLGNCDFGLSNCLYGDFTEYWNADPENQNLLTSINDYKIGYFGTDKKLATPIKYFPSILYADLSIFEKLNVTPPDPDDNWNWTTLMESVRQTTNAAESIYGVNAYYTGITLYPIANDPNCIGEFGWDGHRFNMDLWADGLNEWAGLINSGYRAPNNPSDENEAWTGAQDTWAAYTGKLAWQFDAFWTYINLFDTDDYRNKGMQWVPYCTPTNSAGTTFGVLDMGSISTGTPHPREAYELLKWMGWGKEGWEAKLEAYSTMASDAGVPLFRMAMPCPITLDSGIWEEFTQRFYPTAKERKYESAYDSANDVPLVTAEEDALYGKYFDSYFKNVSRPVAFGDTQIPGFMAFIEGVYWHTAEDVGVETLVIDQGKNAHDYADELAAKALEYNQQSLADAKQAYSYIGIELNYEVITQ